MITRITAIPLDRTCINLDIYTWIIRDTMRSVILVMKMNDMNLYIKIDTPGKVDLFYHCYNKVEIIG